jgi:hypothetical protein
MKATIKSFDVMPDASGAPAVIECNGIRWAFDMLGTLKTNQLGASSGFVPRGMIKASKASSEATYRGELLRRVDAQWLAANVAMYSEDQK